MCVVLKLCLTVLVYFINCFFDYSALFELPTALLEYLDLLQGGCSPLASPGLLCLWFWLWLKYNIAAYPYYWWWIHAYRIETMVPRAPLTYLLSEKKTLRCQLCSTHYEAVWINKCLKRTFAIKVATMKIMDNFYYEWKPSHAYH